MYQVLKGQGLTDLEFMVMTEIGEDGPFWADHAQGYEQATFPVMPDVGGVFQTPYGADYYDVFLVDKKGRLVTKEANFSDEKTDAVNQRIRELHAE